MEVPRLLVLFEAEDPTIFVSRLLDAYSFRQTTEKQLQQQLYIDSMPRSRAKPLPIKAVKVVTGQVTGDHQEAILREVTIHYQRIENEMIFEAEARKNPQLFEALQWTFVSKPKTAASKFPQIPKYNYQNVKSQFSFASLLTRAEVIDALGRVRQECNKV